MTYEPMFPGPYEEEPQEKAEARRAQRTEEKPYNYWDAVEASATAAEVDLQAFRYKAVMSGGPEMWNEYLRRRNHGKSK